MLTIIFMSCLVWVTGTSVASEQLTVAEVIKKEPLVKDASLDEWGTLLVGVIDDGTRRDGFAEYLCLAIADHPSKPTAPKIVRVMDATASLRGEWRELGKAFCPEGPPTVVKFN